MGVQAAFAPNIRPNTKPETGRALKPSAVKAARVSPIAIAVALSIAVHVGIGLYFVTMRFVMPPAQASLEEAMLVEMYLPQIQPDKPKPSPAPPKPQPVSMSPIKTRVIDTPVVSDVAPLVMAAMEAPKTVAAAPVVAQPSPVPAPAAEHFIEVDVDQALARNPAPPYPPKSVQMREQGVVWLRLMVRPDGGVGEVQVKTSSGSMRLDGAARQAVKTWKFTPARRNGQAVELWVNVPIRFNLKS
ncbi:energy transducer TonB [Asticcacaulis sp. ZE23SCel15]|uniref:energy transducer TonB n=1 Tax=Asticcacaulis sp. ZE23SCel15 TaxID=3059027 RepID=UPI00265FB033|nr:energy transducer TonB [Asticcacaulis sp. ZE23SCel15]WKL58668.1 energy transducer TonB [Asticcacaulis sp. ZE23SCel15]